jgi:adenylate cyclase
VSEERQATTLLAPDGDRRRLAAWALAMAVPIAGFLLLLAAPSADFEWEHHPAHFWLVLSAALTSMALAFATGGTALRRADARLFLVSLAFLAAAGFLALHALATPQVLLDGPNQGFVLATPVGLLLASILAAASALKLPPARARWVIDHAVLLRGALIALMALWAAASLASVPPLDDPTPTERASGGLVVPAVLAVLL